MTKATAIHALEINTGKLFPLSDHAAMNRDNEIPVRLDARMREDQRLVLDIDGRRIEIEGVAGKESVEFKKNGLLIAIFDE